jgi:hypothetical protein
VSTILFAVLYSISQTLCTISQCWIRKASNILVLVYSDRVSLFSLPVEIRLMIYEELIAPQDNDDFRNAFNFDRVSIPLTDIYPILRYTSIERFKGLVLSCKFLSNEIYWFLFQRRELQNPGKTLYRRTSIDAQEIAYYSFIPKRFASSINLVFQITGGFMIDNTCPTECMSRRLRLKIWKALAAHPDYPPSLDTMQLGCSSSPRVVDGKSPCWIFSRKYHLKVDRWPVDIYVEQVSVDKIHWLSPITLAFDPYYETIGNFTVTATLEAFRAIFKREISYIMSDKLDPQDGVLLYCHQCEVSRHSERLHGRWPGHPKRKWIFESRRDHRWIGQRYET